jgi:ABC-2 type transport system ATP-binding protein
VAVALDGTPAGDLLAELGALDGVERVEPVAAPEEPRARLYLSGEAPLLVAPVAAVVAGHRAQLTEVAIGTPSLEDVFIALTGRALR